MTTILDKTKCRSIKRSFDGYAIITDDGHGWFTKGKRSFTDPPFYENEFNSIVEAKLMLLLDAIGIEYHQLSPGSIDTKLNNRDAYEHQLVMDIKSQGKTPLGISIHCDGWEDPNGRGRQNSAHGFCVYYYEKGDRFSARGKNLAGCVRDAIILSDRAHDHVITPRHDNGINGANFLMLRETSATWILIESAFMTNDRDLSMLQDDGFRNHRAEAILKGLYEFIK